MIRKILLSLLLTNSVQVMAAEITVYRWVDENDIVHFSQHQPAHDNYTELTMVEALKAKAKAKPNRDALLEKEEKTEAVAQSATVKDSFMQKCDEAKANVKTLNAFDNIQTTDPDGSTRMLTKEEKRQQLILSKKQVEVYCGDL